MKVMVLIEQKGVKRSYTGMHWERDDCAIRDLRASDVRVDLTVGKI